MSMVFYFVRRRSIIAAALLWAAPVEAVRGSNSNEFDKSGPSGSCTFSAHAVKARMSCFVFEIASQTGVYCMPSRLP